MAIPVFDCSIHIGEVILTTWFPYLLFEVVAILFSLCFINSIVYLRKNVLTHGVQQGSVSEPVLII